MSNNVIDFFGCSAVVLENRDLWFADDNGLTKELCADPQENEDEQPEINEPCCACDEAKYEVLSNNGNPITTTPFLLECNTIDRVIYCYGGRLSVRS